MDGRAAIKTGAEGSYVAILPERCLGVALKIEDGATRAAESVVTALLARLGAIDPGHPAAARRLAPPVLSRRGAVAEDQEAEHLLEVGRLLEVQGAELHADDEHARPRLGAHHVARELERVDGRVAAHEPHHRALHGRVEAQALHELEVDAGRREARAGDRDDVGHVARAVGDGYSLQPFVVAQMGRLESDGTSTGIRGLSGGVVLSRRF